MATARPDHSGSIACMSEISQAFGRIERANVRSDAPLQSFDRALRSFAQECLQGMKQRLDGVKVRRILGQVAETCTNIPDRLLRTSDLVKRHVIDHYDVPPPQRRGQTLLYVGQECFAIHGSFDQHRSHDASLTEASDKRHGLPVPHRGIADQALSARAPTVEPQHVGGDCGFVDKYEVGRIKKALLAYPAPARESYVGSLALCRSQAFF